MSKQTSIAASEGHRKFGQLLKRVYSTDEHLVVERDGFPVAVLLSYQEYLQLKRQRTHEALDSLQSTVAQEADSQNLTEEQLQAELRVTRQELFEQRYGSLSAK